MTTHLTTEWRSLAGEYVEVWFRGNLYRRGFVDHAMPDSTAVWIEAGEGGHREYIDKAGGYAIYTTLYPRSPHAHQV